MKKLLVIFTAVFFIVSGHLSAQSSAYKFHASLGWVVDELPLAQSSLKVLVGDFYWQRTLFSSDNQFFDFGYDTGVLLFYIVPIPHAALDVTLLPVGGPRLKIRAGFFYDFIYAGLFGFDVRIGIELRDSFSIEFLIFPTPLPPKVEYETDPSMFFRRITRYPDEQYFADNPDAARFPKALFGVMLTYKFKQRRK